MKFLNRILLGLLTLLVLATGATGALIGTAPGLNWLLQQAEGVLPGSLKIAAVEGGLFGRLHLKQISYKAPEMEAGADELILHWLPGELLQGRFHLAELTVLSPSYTQLLAPPESAETADGPLTLPDIALPIDILIDKIEVRNLQFRPAADAEPVEVSRVLLAAGWTAKGIELTTLELDMPGIGLQAKGEVQPQEHYPLDLQTQLSLALPDAPKTEAAGRIHGDLQRLNIEQKLSGDVQAALKIVLSDPLGQLSWQTDLDLHAFLLQSIAPDTQGRIAGKLQAQGDLKQVKAEGRIRLEDADAFYSPWHTDLKLAADLDKMAIKLDRLGLTRPGTPLELNLSGSADADLNLDIQGRWQALQWPPSGDAQFSSETGALDLQGTAQDYDLSLRAKLAGSDIPSGEWTLRGRGSQEQFEIREFQGKTLDGTLGAKGKVAWAPAVSWDTALTAAGINPGARYPQWPGKLDLVLSSKGTLKDAKPDISAVIEKLAGRLRERALDGTGSIRILGEEITLNRVKLASGATKVEADGRLGSNSDLTWAIHIPDMADLLPEAAGRIQGKGTIKGALATPSVDGSLSAKDVSFQDIRVKTLAADIKLDLSDKTASRVDLRSEDIQVGQERIPSLLLKFDGRKQNHRLQASLEHAMADLALKLRGAYDEPKTAWKGTLENLDIQSKDFGDWDLQKPVKIAAAADDLRMSALCLARDPGFVCAEGKLLKAKGQAEIHAEGLQLQWLQAFLPREIEQLDGALGLQAKATLDKTPLLDAKLSIDPGRVIVHPEGEENIVLEHQGGQVIANLDAKQLAARFNLDIGEDGLKGRINVPRAALDKDPASAPLDGDIHLQFRQLELFSGLIPAIQKLSGEVLAKLELGGRLGQPTIKGEAGLELRDIQIADAGLELKDIAVKARSDDGKNIRLDGGISSGKGRLKLGGDIELDAEKNWPMQITLKGKQFQIMNLPEKNARISTDLAFNSGAEGMLLQGTLEIPQAYLVMDEIPEGATSASADVIVETPGGKKEEPPEKGAPFAMKVTVVSGNDVQFRGFGLKAYFEGKLSVNQYPEEFPTGSGELHIKEGTYKAYGQDLVIERGIVAFSGGRIDNPGLSVRASRGANVDMGDGSVNVTVGVDVSGTAKKPKLSVYSDPAMEERDAIAILLTGNTASNFGKGSGSIGVGKQLTKDLSVGANLKPGTSQTELVTKYRFNRKFHLEATTSTEGNAADVFYSLQFD